MNIQDPGVPLNNEDLFENNRLIQKIHLAILLRNAGSRVGRLPFLV